MRQTKIKRDKWRSIQLLTGAESKVYDDDDDDMYT